MFTSDILNLMETFFGADKLLFWALVAVASTVIIFQIFMTMLYDRKTDKRRYIPAIVIAMAISFVAYCGWIFTYFYNLPLGPPLELVIPPGM